MTETFAVAPRFCGPPDSGNGGYVCGRVAGYLGSPAEITLRRPPPLATPLTVQHAGDGLVHVLDGDALVAEGRRAPERLPIGPADPISIGAARTAGARSPLRAQPAAHPFPTCFVCGLDRQAGDGMRIMVGRVADRAVAADVWYPDATLAGPDGNVGTEFVWAALDCAGGVGALAETTSDQAFVLGRLAVRQLGPVRPAHPYVVTGWRLAADGRKLTAGSAVFAADGRQLAIACATWIQLRAASAIRPAATASRPS
jgi:hypothetical protein